MARPLMLDSGIKKELSSTLSGEVNVRWSPYNATGDGTTDDTTAITTAATASANKKLVFPAGTYRLTGTQSFASTTHVVMDPGATLQVEGTLTINGTLELPKGSQVSGSGTLTYAAGSRTINDQLSQVYGSSLTVTGLSNSGVIDYITPEMFGATGDGSTDDTTAFTSAISALSSGGILQLDVKTYRIDSLDLSSNTVVIGRGKGSVLKQNSSTDVNFITATGTDGSGVENVKIIGGRSEKAGNSSQGDAIVIQSTQSEDTDISYSNTSDADTPYKVDGTYELNLGQTFTTGSSAAEYYQVSLYLYKTSGLDALSKQGWMYLEVRPTSSSLPATSGHRNGKTLPIDIKTTISTTAGWVDFKFPTHMRLEANTEYAVIIHTDREYAEAYDSSTKYVIWYGDGSSPTYSGGSYVSYNGSAWSANTAIDMIFKFSKRTGGSNCFVRDCYITDVVKHGVGLYTTSRVEVSGCQIDDIWQTGVMIYTGNSEARVTNNTISRTAQARYDGTPIYTGDPIVLDNSSSNCVIAGNTCTDGMWGIDIQEGSSYNTITGNTCSGNYKGGIVVTPGGSSQTRRPTIGNVINGNTLSGNGLIGGSEYYGIALQNVQNTIVSNNVVTQNRYGIVLFSSDDYDFELKHNIIDGNIISNNDVYGVRAYFFTSAGLGSASESPDNIIKGNVIKENGQHGIYVDNFPRLLITDNYIVNNNTSNGSYNGIYIDDRSANVEISRNTVADTRSTTLQVYGIRVNLGSTTPNTSPRVIENTVFGNVTGQISILAASPIEYKNKTQSTTGKDEVITDDSDAHTVKKADGTEVFGISTSGVIGPRIPNNQYIWARNAADSGYLGMFIMNTDDNTLAFRQMVHQSAGNQTLTASSTIATSGSYGYRILPIIGSGGAVSLTSAPSIEAGKTLGQIIVLVGQSDTNTVTIYDHGYDPGSGPVNSTVYLLSVNSRTYAAYDYSIFRWVGSKWIEEVYVDYSAL